MFIWDYYFHVIVYVFTTDVEKCDLIIRFYVIKFFSQDPIQSETLEEETSPVPEEISER